MAFYYNEGAIFLLLLLPFLFLFLSSTDALDLQTLLDRQEQQLSKLQDLVESLSSTVSKLELSLSETQKSRLDQSRLPSASNSDSGGEDGRQRRAVGGIAVTKSKPSWLDRFQFLAAARLESVPTCIAVLPSVGPDGLAKYFAVGDGNGRVFIFSSAGDLLIESNTPSGSPVTTILSYYSPRKSESLLFTGHADGSVTANRVSESGVDGEDWVSLSMGTSYMFFKGGRPESGSQVVLLEVHHFGRTRYLVVSDDAGRIRVFTENGTLYGTFLVSSKPLAFMKQRMVFLTESGVSWLDLRTMSVRESGCEGLNGLVAQSYTFDASERSKAYGFSSEGDLIHVVLIGDAGNLKCRVRAVRKSDIDGPPSILAMRGYLLVVNHEKVFLYNVSSQYYSRVGASRPLFFATLAEIRSLFLDSNLVQDGLKVGKPLIAGDREKLVVLGLGDGYIGIYRSNFPVFKLQSNAVLWSSPMLLFLMFLFGICYFYLKKRGSMVWTPEDSGFIEHPTDAAGSILGPVVGDRAFDAQRASDFRDVRGSVLSGGPTRRYASPSSRGTALSYRPSPVDPGFVGADLKYRGQGIESAGFPKRREPLFMNAQALDDHID